MMRKMILITLFSILCIVLPAPERAELYILKPIELTAYEALIKAVVMVESNGNINAYNAKENAVGAFQIRQCRIDDYNTRTGSNYTLKDCYDYEVSRKVFLYFAEGKSFEIAVKNWNGSGPLTISYWQKVQAYL